MIPMKGLLLSLGLVLAPYAADAEMQCDFLSEDYFTRDGHADDVVACLKRGYTFDIQDAETGNTPLHLAAKNLEDPFVLYDLALLIEPDELREKLVETPNRYGMNPFHVAVAEGRGAHFIANIARWGDPIDTVFDEDGSTIFNTRGTTALHLAMKDWISSPEQVDRVLTLLALGADTQISDRDSQYPLDLVGREDYTAALLLDESAWRVNVENTLASVANTSLPLRECRAKLTEGADSLDPGEAWSCIDSLLNARSDPSDFWNLLEGGDNILHQIIKLSTDPMVLDEILGVADKHGTLIEALSAENIDGDAAIHLAAKHADPLTIVQLARWGADVNRIARPADNGFLQQKTGDTPLHLAARREPLSDSTRAITALLALGADSSIYDNNFEENRLEQEVGLQPIDYMNKLENFAAMSLIAPGFSFCETIDEYEETAKTALGLAGVGVAVSSSATAASTAAGVTAVTHSSGAIILTGSSGYIAGTLGTFATSLIAVLTAPATLTAAGVVVVFTGGSIIYCSSTD